MERLTFKQADGTWGLVKGDITKVPPELYGAMYKLMHYEESGFTPTELERLPEVYAAQRKELLELREKLADYEATGITPEQIVEMDKMYMDRRQEIADMKRRMAAGTGWIPCNEKAPKPDDYILLSFENFSIPLVGRYEEDENGGAFYIGDEDKTCVSQGVFVNAWQPLPKMYRQEEKDGGDNV